MKRVIPAKSDKAGSKSATLLGSAMSFPKPSALDPCEPSERTAEEMKCAADVSEREDMTEYSESAIFPAAVKKNSGGMSSQANLHSKSIDFAKLQSKTSEKAAWKRLRKNFIEEMRQLSKLRHPCICTVMGAVIGKSVEPMLIMEFMDHGSLNDMLNNDTIVIDGEVILPILRDISKGMRFLHSANPQVIHGGMCFTRCLIISAFPLPC